MNNETQMKAECEKELNADMHQTYALREGRDSEGNDITVEGKRIGANKPGRKEYIKYTIYQGHVA